MTLIRLPILTEDMEVHIRPRALTIHTVWGVHIALTLFMLFLLRESACLTPGTPRSQYRIPVVLPDSKSRPKSRFKMAKTTFGQNRRFFSRQGFRFH